MILAAFQHRPSHDIYARSDFNDHPVNSDREAEGRPPCVLHVLPLRRNAHDIFSGGDILIAVTALSASSTAPSPAVVESLFDLTQSEVSFASALAQGRTVSEASRQCGLKVSSERTYLARIFAKTGTHRQAELVALLASAHP